MKTHENSKRGFMRLSEAWYGSLNAAEEVMLGFYHNNGGTSGEFAIRWMKINGKEAPRLEAFDDSWSALYEFRDVLAKLAERDNENIGPTELCSLLVECGIEDMTQRQHG